VNCSRKRPSIGPPSLSPVGHPFCTKLHRLGGGNLAIAPRAQASFDRFIDCTFCDIKRPRARRGDQRVSRGEGLGGGGAGVVRFVIFFRAICYPLLPRPALCVLLVFRYICGMEHAARSMHCGAQPFSQTHNLIAEILPDIRPGITGLLFFVRFLQVPPQCYLWRPELYSS
jgi:hypothetical protein